MTLAFSWKGNFFYVPFLRFNAFSMACKWKVFDVEVCIVMGSFDVWFHSLYYSEHGLILCLNKFVRRHSGLLRTVSRLCMYERSKNSFRFEIQSFTYYYCFCIIQLSNRICAALECMCLQVMNLIDLCYSNSGINIICRYMFQTRVYSILKSFSYTWSLYTCT